jgi:hypothetical protein
MSTETMFETLPPIPQFTTFSAVKAELDKVERKTLAVMRYNATECLIAFSWDTPTNEELALAKSVNPAVMCLFMPPYVRMIIRKDGLNDIMDKHGDLPCAVFYLEICN